MRKEIKRARYRLEDDVTCLNFEIINRLINNEQIHSASFFNGNILPKHSLEKETSRKFSMIV